MKAGKAFFCLLMDKLVFVGRIDIADCRQLFTDCGRVGAFGLAAFLQTGIKIPQPGVDNTQQDKGIIGKAHVKSVSLFSIFVSIIAPDDRPFFDKL